MGKTAYGNFLVKSNLITKANYDLTAGEQNIFYMVHAQISEDDPIDKVYYIYITDMEQLTGKQLNRRQVFNDTLRLLKKTYRIKQGEDILEIPILSSAEYIHDKSTIAVSVHPKMRPYIFATNMPLD